MISAVVVEWWCFTVLRTRQCCDLLCYSSIGFPAEAALVEMGKLF